MNLEGIDVRVVVKAIDSYFEVSEVELSKLPSELFKWELGGLADPLGQLINWLWGRICEAFETVEGAIKGVISSVRSALECVITSARDAIIGTINAVSGVVSSIYSFLQGLPSTIWGFFAVRLPQVISTGIQIIRDWIATAIQPIASAIGGISSFLTDIWNKLATGIVEIGGAIYSNIQWVWSQVQNAFADFGKTIKGWFEEATKRLEDLGYVFQGFVNAVANIWNWLTTSAEKFVTNAINFFTKDIPGFFSWVYGNVKAFIDNAINFFAKAIPDFFNWVYSNLKGFIDNAVKFFTKDVPDFFAWVYANIKGFIDSAGKFFTQDVPAFFSWVYTNISDFIVKLVNFYTQTLPELLKSLAVLTAVEFGKTYSAFYENIAKPVQDWFAANFGGPLVGGIQSIVDFFTKTLPDWFKKVTDFFADLPKKVRDFLSWMRGGAEWLINEIYKGLSTLWGWIKSGLDWLWKSLLTAASWLWEGMLSIGKAFVGFSQGVFVGRSPSLLDVFIPAAVAVSKSATDAFMKIMKPFFDEFSKTYLEVFKGGVKGEMEVFMPWMDILLPAVMGPRVLAGILFGLASVLSAVNIPVHVLLSPFGVGAETGVNISVNLGAVVGEIAKAIGEGGVIIAHSIFYGLGIWLFQPLRSALNYTLRDYLPVQIPTLEALTELVRRTYATPEFDKFKEYMAGYMAFMGYSSSVIEWFTGYSGPIPPPPTGPEIRSAPKPVKIKNRFKEEVELPVELIYSMPTPSELARMMVHDIFLTYEDFETAMKMHGFKESLAKLYYLLHFRYPTPENLWLFYCRAVSGFLWYEKVKKVDPAKFLNTALPSYMKWHDYYPESWFRDETVAPPDNAIMIELMADIPTRIDVRWMYKWCIVDDEFVRKVVTARGMHPDYVDDIAIAEMMNALAEERTYARTGVIELVREGLITIDEAKKRLENLITVKLLGKDVPVKFLPGEVELLLLRASTDIQRESAQRRIERIRNLYISGEIDDATLEKELQAIIKDKTVYETTLTEIKARKIRDQLYYTHRQLLRTVDAICALYEEGYITKSEAESRIKEATGNLLTQKQIDLILLESELRIERGAKRSKLRAILNRLRRGAITPEEAKKELVNKLGLSEDMAMQVLEAEGRTYSITISTLLAYADIIQVPESLLVKKLELMGVPEDEKSLILEVFKVRPIRNELSSVISAAISDFVDGYMTEDALTGMLSKAFKKPEEINILVTAAKIRRENKVKDYQVQAILAKLRRGEIGISEAKAELGKIILIPALVDALIDRTVGETIKEYTLSISTLLAYAEITEISEDFLKARMQKLNIPQEDQSIILQVFNIRPIRDELARQVRAILDNFEDGYIDEKTAREQLASCFKRPREIDILIETSTIEKEARKKRLKIDATLNKLKRGAITLDSAKAELSKLIADPELVELIIEKNARIYTISLDRLISMREYIPIPDDVLKQKMTVLGVPEDEQKYILPYSVAREISSELGKYVTQLGNLYVDGKISDADFKKELDNVATLWGQAPKLLGVEWVVYSPQEREIIYQVYRMMKLRKAKSA